MSIIRRSRADNFTIIPNAVADDERLSFEARGVLCYLLAKPHDWRVNVTNIQNNGNIGRNKAYRIVRELREVGYLELSETRDGGGKILGWEYVLHDVAEVRIKPLPEKPVSGKPASIIRNKDNKGLNIPISSLRSEIDPHFSQNEGFSRDADFLENENLGLEPEPASSKTGTENATETVGGLAKRKTNPPSQEPSHNGQCEETPLDGEILTQNAPNLAKNEIEAGRTLFNFQDDIRYQTDIQNAPVGFNSNSRGYLDEDTGQEFELTEPQTPIQGKKQPAKAVKKPSEKALAMVAKNAVLTREFEEMFWPKVIRKLGKAAARKAWLKAREKAGLQTIMDGLQRYQQAQIAQGTDRKFWLHASTFLNGERWEDEPEPIWEKRNEQHNTNYPNQGQSKGEEIADIWRELDRRERDRQSGKEVGKHFSGDFSSQPRINLNGAKKTGTNGCSWTVPALIATECGAYQ